jgi:sterol desaturase/sphingolipid hydroxylase (fatty acid hydroxylase superfamily)
MDFVKPTIFAIPFFILTVALEWWAVKSGRANGRYETKDAITSLVMGMGSAVVDTLLASVGLWMLMLFWPYRLLEVPVTWWSFILVFFAYDLIYYWKHRFAHVVRWWWIEHHTHHSSQHYNLTTALRQPWFGPLTGLVIIAAPLVLLGFHPAFIAFSAGINLVYQYWIHTEAVGRLGPLEWVLNTPAHHRVHHASNPAYLDRNFGGVLIIYDRVFGTLAELNPDDPIRYGLTKPINSRNIFAIALGEWRSIFADLKRARTWRERFTAAFGRPA